MTPDQFTFGMAFSQIGRAPGEIRDFLLFPEFDAAELPWEVFTSAPQLLKTAQKKKMDLLCGSVTDPQLSRMIAFAEEKMQRDFAGQLRNALTFLAEKDIRTATLACPLNDILGDPDAEQALRSILLGAAPVLQEKSMTLLLPLTIQSADGALAMPAAKFLRDTLLPGIKLRLDIYPWNLPPKSDPRKAAGLLGYETRVLTFRYDADCGNRIKTDFLENWLPFLALKSTVLLAPFSLRNRMAMAEGEQFAGILRDLRQFSGLDDLTKRA